jgi:hypothetical protein
MSMDQILVISIIIIALAIPSLLAAYSESRAPRAAAIMLMIGGVLMVVALTQKPGGYKFDEIPNVFVRVIGELMH